jgi:nucleotide-binding universal stress UspA family protein
VNPPRRSTVLFALSGDAQPNASLLRAATMACVHGAELEVLRVLAGPVPHGPGRAQVRDAIATLRALTATRSWVREVTGAEPAAGRVRVRTGDFMSVTVGRASDVDAELVVLAPFGKRSGKFVTELARRAGRPVLVAREAARESSILVATDLEDPRHPVLQQGVKLSRGHAHVVALHNVTPVVPLLSLPAMHARLSTLERAQRAARDRLQHATEGLPAPVETVLAREASPVTAILHEAYARSGGLIVVGTRPKSWFNRLVSANVAAQVVNRAQRSVVVTPVLPSPAA